MDMQTGRSLLQRFYRGADVSLATVKPVSDEHDIQAGGLRLLGSLD
jgi:hypothetical protein